MDLKFHLFDVTLYTGNPEHLPDSGSRFSYERGVAGCGEKAMLISTCRLCLQPGRNECWLEIPTDKKTVYCKIN
jgi:hypothetical protein